MTGSFWPAWYVRLAHADAKPATDPLRHQILTGGFGSCELISEDSGSVVGLNQIY